MLCAAYTLLSRCCGEEGECPFLHDATLRRSLGTEDRNRRKMIIESMLSANMAQQSDGKTMHLERTNVAKPEDEWKSEEITEAEAEAVRFESYFEEIEQEAEEDDNMRKDVGKAMEAMTEHGNGHKDPDKYEKGVKTKATFETISREIRNISELIEEDLIITDVTYLR